MKNKIKAILLKVPYIAELKVKYPQYLRNILAPIRKIGLKNREFTIISNNCWGGIMYQYYGLEYRTPFIGLFIPMPCYIKLLSDFDAAMAADLSFIEAGQSEYYRKIPDLADKKYPIGVLPGGIEIHFLHYKSREEARAKWEKRKSRINKNNMLVKMAEIDFCTKELIEKFDNLPFKNKICYTANNYPGIKSAVRLPAKYTKNGEVLTEWKYRPSSLKAVFNGLKD